MTTKAQLTTAEKKGIVLAVESAFVKLDNLYEDIIPIFDQYGFKPPSAGVIARDLSEKIETSIIQHCKTFEKGKGHADLHRLGKAWEVKICKGNGLTINQSKQIGGENYIVVNYKPRSKLRKVWILWRSKDSFFSERKSNSNARTIVWATATKNIEVIYDEKTDGASNGD